MVSITLSVSEDVRRKMERFPEINWSGFVRASIEEKVEKLMWREEMLKKLEGEAGFDEWAVPFGRKVKKRAYEKLGKKRSGR